MAAIMPTAFAQLPKTGYCYPYFDDFDRLAVAPGQPIGQYQDTTEDAPGLNYGQEFKLGNYTSDGGLAGIVEGVLTPAPKVTPRTLPNFAAATANGQTLYIFNPGSTGPADITIKLTSFGSMTPGPTAQYFGIESPVLFACYDALTGEPRKCTVFLVAFDDTGKQFYTKDGYTANFTFTPGEEAGDPLKAGKLPGGYEYLAPFAKMTFALQRQPKDLGLSLTDLVLLIDQVYHCDYRAAS